MPRGVQDAIEIKDRLTCQCTNLQCRYKDIFGWKAVRIVGLLHLEGEVLVSMFNAS